MKNIAIFVSGRGEAAERIIKLFNEGNRLKTVLLYADDSASDIISRISDEEVEFVHYPDSEWPAKAPALAQSLREKDVRLLVLDQFALAIPDEILEATQGEMIRVSSSELAPREVVAALEAEFRKPQEETVETVEETTEDSPTPPSVESEWADTLNIQFKPPRIPSTPPEVPDNELKESSQTPFEKPQYQYPKYEVNEPGEEKNVPMPSTWLIWSVLVTIFCCFIPGIIAIIFSSQVSTRYYSGDIEGARRASHTAEIWIIVSFVLGVISATLWLPFMMLGN